VSGGDLRGGSASNALYTLHEASIDRDESSGKDLPGRKRDTDADRGSRPTADQDRAPESLQTGPTLLVGAGGGDATKVAFGALTAA
jgi:hypothetical protein